MSFSFKIEKYGTTNVIFLEGTLNDKLEAQGMLDQVESLIASQSNQFVISLEHSKYMNSTGLNILINVLTKARKAGGEAVICSVPDKIQELLLVTKLNTVFSVSEDVEAAIAKM